MKSSIVMSLRAVISWIVGSLQGVRMPNEFADGIEIDEGALEGDLREYVRNEINRKPVTHSSSQGDQLPASVSSSH